MGRDRKADKRKGWISCCDVKVFPFHCQAEHGSHNQQRPGGTATIGPFELMVRNWQASEKDYLELKGLTSLLDNDLGFKK